MTQAEMTLAAALLRRAADQFHNHGCNDFDLREVLPDPADRQAVEKRAQEHAGWEESDFDPNQCDIGHDAMLMDYLADRLGKHADYCLTEAEWARLPLSALP